jgi:hypothetical protein
VAFVAARLSIHAVSAPSNYNLNLIPPGAPRENDAPKQEQLRQSGDNVPGRIATTECLPGKTKGSDYEQAYNLSTLSLIRKLFHLFGEM